MTEMTSSPSRVTTQQRLADALGVNIRQLSRWKRLGAPIRSTGPYDVVAVARWARENLERSKVGRDGSDSDTERELRDQKLEAQIRLLAAQADQEELRLGVLEGRLIPVADAVAEISGVVTRIKQSMFAMPRAHSPDFVLYGDQGDLEGAWMAVLTREFERFTERKEERNAQREE